MIKKHDVPKSVPRRFKTILRNTLCYIYTLVLYSMQTHHQTQPSFWPEPHSWRVVTDGPDAITITKSVCRRTNRHMYTWQSTQKPVVAGKNGIQRCSIAYHVIVYTCNPHQNNICICAICSPSRSDCSALGASESYKCYQGISAQAAVIIGCYTHRHDK